MNTFFQICIYITMIMIVFTLCVNFITLLNIFDTGGVYSGVNVGNNTNETFQFFTSGFTINQLWLAVLMGSGLAGIALAWITRSTSIIAVYIFSVVFWASYTNALAITHIGDYIPGSFLFIGTASMIFIWVAAIIGMLSGSG